MGKPTFAEVLDILHEIAPLELAAEWDNVGVLVQPQRRPGRVARVMLTIDATVAVVAEAVAARSDLLVSYHPPIFQAQKRLIADGGTSEAVLRAAAAGLAIYSPHTALDAAPNGLADWLVEQLLAGEAPTEMRTCGEGEFGRLVTLAKPLSFRTLLARCKRRFGVRELRVAQPKKLPAKVRSFAIAAGAGAGVLRGADAEVLITGEMSHHDALAAVAAGRTVVIAGHSNTERGFLRVLRRRLASAFGGDLDVRIAVADRDPFTNV